MMPIYNISREDLNKLVKKYEEPLSSLTDTYLYPYYALAIDIAEPLLIKKDKIFNSHWKALIVLFLTKNITNFKTQSDIEKFIVEFEIHFKNEYDKYHKESIIEDDFERDFIFLKIFTDKRNRDLQDGKIH